MASVSASCPGDLPSNSTSADTSPASPCPAAAWIGRSGANWGWGCNLCCPDRGGAHPDSGDGRKEQHPVVSSEIGDFAVESARLLSQKASPPVPLNVRGSRLGRAQGWKELVGHRDRVSST